MVWHPLMVCSDVLNPLFWRRLNLDDGLRQRLSELPGTKNLANLALRANALSDVRVGAAALLSHLTINCTHNKALPACIHTRNWSECLCCLGEDVQV